MGFRSRIDEGSETFAANRAAMLARVEALRALEARAAAKSEARRAVFDKRGQLSPRERLAALLDPGMPWLELYNLASYGVDDPDPETSVPGASVICGIGFVAATRVMVWIDDSGIDAGASTAMTVGKVRGVLDIARRQRLPLIHLVESAGANLMSYTVELWAHGGALFAGLARHSAAGLPVVTVLHGASTAGGAYFPGLSDHVIGVRGNGMAMLAGAALVKAATGEEATDAALGGAEMHAEVTGLVDHLAENDAEALGVARDVVAGLGWARAAAPHEIAPPALSPETLAGAIPLDPTRPADPRELVARIVDNSDFRETGAGYGPQTMCLTARIMGHAVGIVANHGPLDPEGAAKATHFLQTQEQAGQPVVFLHNTTGFLVGTDSERAGMIKHGSKLIQAVTNLSVPKLSLYVGASFGAGNYAMCGLEYGPDFLFAWPSARTGVMGGAQAATTMAEVARRTAARKGVAVDEARLAAQGARIAAHFDAQSEAFHTSGRLLDMGVIDPRDTRRVLGFCLDTCAEARARAPRAMQFGVARP